MLKKKSNESEYDVRTWRKKAQQTQILIEQITMEHNLAKITDWLAHLTIR